MKKSGVAVVVPTTVILCCLLSHAAVAIETLATITYPPYLPSACFDDQHRDISSHLVGVTKSMWNNGANCGKKLRIICTAPVPPWPRPQTCRNNFVDAIIFDFCGGCQEGGLNLSEEAFETIADKAAGVIEVDYHWVV